jgi:hypothetical protein
MIVQPLRILSAGLVLAALWVGNAYPRDAGQWEGSDPVIRGWYQDLKAPDAPTMSCCGEADAYWCDEIHVRAGKKTSCVITDDRDDAPLHRPHIDVGTEIEIPDAKLKWDEGNPTGHAVVFLSRQRYVYCFVMGGGT